MPRLLLLRHAHAEAADENNSDFFRPLSRKGVEAATKTGEYLAENGLYPQRILCSAAKRTRETLSALLPYLPEDSEIRIARQIYETTAHGLLSAVHNFGADAEIMMIIGHDPGISLVGRVLAMRGQENALAQIKAGFPTNGLAIIDFDVPNWVDIIPGNGWVAGFHAC